MQDFDLIIVGGGIAGGSLATVMARAGADVLVLERQSEFRDQVRGELLWPWGVRVAQQLDLEPVFIGAGAPVVRWMLAYDEGSGTPQTSDVGMILDGVDGSVNLAHPVACRALVDAATSAGAHVRIGVRDVQVSAGARPSARWVGEGDEVLEARAALVVGADGRRSSVRLQASIPFEVDSTAHQIAGVLVDGVEGMDTDVNLAARESDLLFLAFPQNDGRARLYFNFPTEQRTRFAGKDAARRFLDACRLNCLNGVGEWHRAHPAGPCATFPGADSRAPVPLAEGVVLIGDAAGFENPLRGQGLAMALQDVHDVSRALLSGSPPSEALRQYVDARAARQRLAHLATAVTVWAHDGFSEQDPELRASRTSHCRQDDVLAPLGNTIWSGYDTLPQDVTAAEVATRLDSYDRR